MVWNNITADREDERSNREFLQTQRVTAYSEYLTAVDEARQLMGPFLPPDDAGETRRLELPYPDAPQLLAIQGANDNVETLFSRVYVLAGVDVAI